MLVYILVPHVTLVYKFTSVSDQMPLNEEAASDPLRFVKTGHAPLSQKAQEQLRMVSQQAGSWAQQRLKAQEEDEAVDWQSKLASWKNRRRRQMPQKRLEDDDPPQQRPNQRRAQDPFDGQTMPASDTVRLGSSSDVRTDNQGRRSGDVRGVAVDVRESSQQIEQGNAQDSTDVRNVTNVRGSSRGYLGTMDYAQERDCDVGSNYARDNGLDGDRSSGGGRTGRNRNDWSRHVDGSPVTARVPGICLNSSGANVQQYAESHAWHRDCDYAPDDVLKAGTNDNDPCALTVTTSTNLLSEFSCGGAFQDSHRSRSHGPEWGTKPYEQTRIRHEGPRKEAPRPLPLPPLTAPEAPSEPPLSVSGRQRCSHCRNALGHGAAMVIESLGLLYHLECFRCCVCRAPLGNGRRGTDVRVRNTKLHCCNCYSNDEVGLQLSRV